MPNPLNATTCAADPYIEREHLAPYIDNCYRAAIGKLHSSYNDSRPAAVLVSEGRFGPEHVIQAFLSNIDSDTTVVQISESCASATAFMTEIVHGIGFRPNGLDLQDLEKILELFLQYQRTHRRRTVIVVGDSHAHGWWVLDKIRRLIETEAAEHFGLMMIIAGPPAVIPTLNEPILDVIMSEAGERIVLTPFSMSETREYIRQRIEGSESSQSYPRDIGRRIEFFAVNLIHEISNGVPDDVSRLYSKCAELAEESNVEQISPDIVKRAAGLLALTEQLPADDEDSSPTGEYRVIVPEGKLVIDTPGEAARDVALDQNCVLVGRDKLCGICLPEVRASRFHAFFALTTDGLQVVDLGSTNGTRVNGRKVERCLLKDGDTVSVAGTSIAYHAGGEQVCWPEDSPGDEDSIDSAETFESPISYVGGDLQLIRTS